MRKIKATPGTIPEYHAFFRSSITYNGKEYKGTFFTLSNGLTVAQKEALLNKHGNIKFFVSRAQYAPEIQHPVIFVADNNFKEVAQ